MRVNERENTSHDTYKQGREYAVDLCSSSCVHVNKNCSEDKPEGVEKIRNVNAEASLEATRGVSVCVIR